MVNEEINSLLPIKPYEIKNVDNEMINKLPSVVQKWLIHSNIIGKVITQTVFLTQKGEMRTTPDGKWMPFEAKQYFNVINPAFIWKVNVKMAPLINLEGRDKYLNGKGHMLINLLSVFPVADAKGKEIDQGTLIRFMAECIWFPSSALSNYLSWEEIDSKTAKATMSYKGTTASGIFKFNSNGDCVSFEAKRYFDSKKGAKLEDWLVTIDESGYKEFEGVRIPTKATLTWKLKEGDFNWLKIDITSLKYNVILPI